MRLREIARIVRGRFYGLNLDLKNILPPEEAKKDSLTFLFNPAVKTQAGAVISTKMISGKSGVIVSDCRKAMFYLLKSMEKEKVVPEVAHTAIIEKDVKIPKSCIIEPYAIIKSGVEIGKGCYIGAGAYLDKGVKIGCYCKIGHNTVVYKNTVIGDFVEIGANSVIGKEGFGYIKFKRYKRICHIGGVLIKDYVEIGANVAIDRGTIGNTIIEDGTKIDNLVHIAHNVHIGKNCLIMGQAGIAGSTRIRDNVILCGQTGVSDHLTIGKNVVVYAKSGVFSNLKTNKRYSGIPAREHYIVLRALARLYRGL
ncbi:MAG: UDP-3-O-(3-hydroxymyristoyl)glucosamine N-acyltransferase [bacterium]